MREKNINNGFPTGLTVFRGFIKGVYRTKPAITKEPKMDEKNKDIDEREETVKCAWCGDNLPKSEMLKEADLGHICRHCADALRSRGEKLTIKDE